jgi:uncharacterized damage-inducible protein DinB
MTSSPDPVASEFLTYNRWANLQLIDTLAALTPEQLSASAPGVYGSIYATLVHIIRAEAGYFHRLTGTRLPPPFAWETNPSPLEIRPYAEQVGTALFELAQPERYTQAVTEAYQGQTFHYPGMIFLLQAVQHGIEHRTNITTLLAQNGIETPDIDGWGYMKTLPAGAAD